MYKAQMADSATFRHYPFVYVLGYHQAKHVLKHSNPFSSTKTPPNTSLALTSFRKAIRYLLFQHDGATHKALRDFGTSGMRGIDLNGIVGEENNRIVGTLKHRNNFDFINDWSLPLSVSVTRRLLGLPTEFEAEIGRWAMDLARIAGLFFTEEDFKIMEEVCQEIEQCVYQLSQDGFFANGQGFLANLWRSYQQRGLSEENVEELVSWAALIVLSSLETTNGGLGNSVYNLLNSNGQFDMLKKDLGLVRIATEELLRFDAPLQFVSRVLTSATTIDGLSLEKGDMVVVGLGAANRDEEVFANADQLQINRKPNPHIAFGFGEHSCFGARVARLEMEHLLTSLVKTFPNIGLAGIAPTMRSVNTIRGFASLQLIQPLG